MRRKFLEEAHKVRLFQKLTKKASPQGALQTKDFCVLKAHKKTPG
jgi:hypothetical protein